MINEPNSANTQSSEQWQQETLNKLIFASLNEQRRTRRWNIFFKILFLGYLFLLLFIMLLPGSQPGDKLDGKPHTALIEIKGVISSESDANADSVVSSLRSAFENKHTRGIILRINSPGGSPVQSGYINDEIHRLKAMHPDKKVYAVIADLCASGGYYIASAADEIYADKASLVGSIGVIMNSFGFVESIKKLGIERRLYTAGENKGFLDPFSPENKNEVQHVKSMLKNIHQQFIDVVKKGRGDKLKNTEKLFSGLIWTGEQSVELGLVDGLASSSYVARELIKAERIVDYSYQKSYLERLTERLGAAAGTSISENLGLARDLQLR